MARPDQRGCHLAAQARQRPSRPRRADQGTGRTGPGLGPERAIPRCARSFRITAGSCSVAISRSRPPQCGHARTSIANARCIKAAQLQAREPLFAFVPFEPPACGAASKSWARPPRVRTRPRARASGRVRPGDRQIVEEAPMHRARIRSVKRTSEQGTEYFGRSSSLHPGYRLVGPRGFTGSLRARASASRPRPSRLRAL